MKKIKCTIIVYTQSHERSGYNTGLICNVIEQKKKAPIGEKQKCEFVHLVGEFTLEQIIDMRLNKYRVDIESKFNTDEVQIVKDKTRVSPWDENVIIDDTWLVLQAPELWQKPPEEIV